MNSTSGNRTCEPWPAVAPMTGVSRSLRDMVAEGCSPEHPRGKRPEVHDGVTPTTHLHVACKATLH